MKKKGKAAPEGQNEDVASREDSCGCDPAAGCEGSCGDAECGCDEAGAEQDETALRLAEQNDRYLRLYAEFDNYRKRTQKEKEALYGDCVARVSAEWLPVIDNLTRAAAAAGRAGPEVDRSIGEGIEMVLRQAADTLSKLGIEAIETVGRPFDPELHEAVMHVEQEGIDAATIVEEFQKGYRRGDRVIRHSMVKVAN